MNKQKTLHTCINRFAALTMCRVTWYITYLCKIKLQHLQLQYLWSL